MKNDQNIDEFEILEEIVEDLEVIQVRAATNIPKFHEGTSYRQSKEIEDLEYERELRKALSECIRHHEIVLEFSRKLKEFYESFLIFKVSHGAFLLCFATYVATVVSSIQILSNCVLIFIQNII